MGVDTGGTFTDFVIMDEKGTLTYSKASSTPEDPSVGVLNSIEATAQLMNMSLEDVLRQAVMVVHGDPMVHGGPADRGDLTVAGDPTGVLVVRGDPMGVLVVRGDRMDHRGEVPDTSVPFNV